MKESGLNDWTAKTLASAIRGILDLNDVEYKEILNYFIFHRNDSEESLVEWLYDWISTNRYELPKEFSIRMAHKYHESVTEVFGDE